MHHVRHILPRAATAQWTLGARHQLFTQLLILPCFGPSTAADGGDRAAFLTPGSPCTKRSNNWNFLTAYLSPGGLAVTDSLQQT